MPLRLLVALLALVWLVPAPVAAQSFAADAAATAYLQRNAARHGVLAADVAELVVTDRVPVGTGAATAVYLRQAVGGVPVADGQLTVTVLPDGRVLHAAGRLVPDLARRVAAGTAPSVDAASAANAVARAVEPHTGLRSARFAVAENARAGARVTLTDGGIARLPALAQLVWAYATPGATSGALRLAWETTLYLPGEAGDWYGLVDARTGAVLYTEDRLVREVDGFDTFHQRAHDHAAEQTATEPVLPRVIPFVGSTGSPFLDVVDALVSSGLANGAAVAAGNGHAVAAGTGAATAAIPGASYRVYAYPVESPNHTTPVPPADARTLEVDPHDPQASPYGWHDSDGAPGAEFTDTRGNNVWAYLDSSSDNTWHPGDSPDCGASLTCDFPVNLAGAPSTYVAAAVTNLFYWNNLIHDVLWHHGFNEASGNFQMNNYGRGGLGNDPVNAEAQDGSGTNNANFSTPPDGQRPRMQMYRGTNVTPHRDGDFDNAVVVHEYGHGISIRLTGGPSNVGCLSTSTYPEQGGEGWSDYYGLMLSMRATDTGAQPRGMGTYLFGQPATGAGIRPSPYSTSFAVNNYTYARTNNTSLPAPHGIGFVWATILWEATWELIAEHGFDPDVWNASGTAGNQVMFRLVTEGMKLQPCGPGFVDARNAILAADQALYAGEHTALLWRAFARRGLGLNASQGLSTSRTDQVEDFTEPETIAPAPVTDLAALPNGDFVTLTFTATGNDGTVGTATVYDVRYSTTPITDDATFSAATQMTGEPAPQIAGTPESFALPGLAFTTTYYVAMKVSDNSFNVSELSNVVQVTTLAAPVVMLPSEAVQAAVPVAGQSTTAPFLIMNNGPSDLRYTVTLAEATRRTPTADVPESDAPEAAEEPKGSPGTPGAASPERGRGGPDAFGYTWIDSNEPGGPAFSWVDISTTGTAVTLSDDASTTVPLPFAFSFYGVDQTSVRITSNGFLAFGGTSNAFTNAAIPTAAVPNNMLAAFWDDLNPATGGSIRYRDMGDGRFVVSWLAVPRFGAASETMTFQAILYSNGQIVYQYQTMNGTLNSATIGIENATGTVGLQVVFNSAYVQNGLAIRFSALWVDALPSSGTIAPGEMGTVMLTFDSSGMPNGTYNAVMTVATNDPARPSAVVPVTFVVGGTISTEGTDAFEGTHRLSAVAPNPAAGRATATLAVAEAQHVRVALYDALGRHVATVFDGPMAARAAVRFEAVPGGLAAGTYVLRVAGEHFADTRRVTVTR